MKLKVLYIALMLLSSGAASVYADAVLTVNGMKVEKAVTRLTFEEDKVNVTFSDDSAACYDMGDVSFSFIPEAGIESISSFSTLAVTVGDKLEISGLTEGCLIKVFDMRGVLTAQAAASGSTCVVDISHLEGGSYILKAGNEVVKFIKR